ncbi:ribokinase [Celeribacter marinus]|uniref:Ribokinase n=1 Tax=Celeribacter marinus TaxID=1397108 RepID=A0A0N7HIN7_9RHOB|nr:ribokinase [Celeribacter marinus]ALI55733.1 ribokinase [Celeribacter marinus]SFL04632.1 ribokinase [Celeribacter marinus]
MAIYNLGSVNIDHFYTLPHFPTPGETLHAVDHSFGLGGKGTNQSVAVAKAGADVFHVGAIGINDKWVRERMESYGVNTTYVSGMDAPTGQAIINIDAAGENTIVLLAGANVKQDADVILNAIDNAQQGDTLLLQNETNLQDHAARFALVKKMRVIYSAAPFDVDAVAKVISDVSILVMNSIEAAQLTSALGVTLDNLPVPQLIVTLGSKGAMWRSNETGEVLEVSVPKVTPVDTTAAGDTFIGYVAAGLDKGMSIKDAMEWASRAAALKVTRKGSADAIPYAQDVEAFSS